MNYMRSKSFISSSLLSDSWRSPLQYKLTLLKLCLESFKKLRMPQGAIISAYFNYDRTIKVSQVLNLTSPGSVYLIFITQILASYFFYLVNIRRANGVKLRYIRQYLIFFMFILINFTYKLLS